MLPPLLASRLSLPVVAAPLFLVSGTALVIESCKNGILGSFPTLNARTTEILEQWLNEISSSVASAPYAANLIVHHTNTRMRQDLQLLVKYRVPVVITSLGAVPEVVHEIHAYKGLVFHDVTNLRHAEKAVNAGVDGLIAVCSGAGGHSGLMSPFALIRQLRARFASLPILAAGAIGDGATIRAVQTLGADLAYMGTRFVGTQEAIASDDYKNMLVESSKSAFESPPSYLPVVYTDRVSGVPANFLRESLKKLGINPNSLDTSTKPVREDFSKLDSELKAWRNIWSAGHGAVNITDIPTVKQLVARLRQEYDEAVARESGELAQWTKSKSKL